MLLEVEVGGEELVEVKTEVRRRGRLDRGRQAGSEKRNKDKSCAHYEGHQQ